MWRDVATPPQRMIIYAVESCFRRIPMCWKQKHITGCPETTMMWKTLHLPSFILPKTLSTSQRKLSAAGAHNDPAVHTPPTVVLFRSRRAEGRAPDPRPDRVGRKLASILKESSWAVERGFSGPLTEINKAGGLLNLGKRVKSGFLKLSG